MSDQPHARPDETPGTGTTGRATQHSPVHDGGPLDDVPPVAGGTDDSPPAQGEGASDSW